MPAGAVFAGLEFVVEPIIGSESKSAEVKKKISDNGGVLSRIVTEETSYVIICDILNIDHTSPRLVKAQQCSVPIIGAEYIEGCVRSGHKLPHEDFTVIIKTERIEEHATLSPSVLTDSKPQEPAFSHPSRVQVWNWDDPNSPAFPTGEDRDTTSSYELVKSILLQKSNKREEASSYCVLEIHSVPRHKGPPVQEDYDNKDIHRFTYRVCTHQGNLQDVKDINCGKKECRYTETGREAEQVYSYLYDSFTNQGHHRTTDLLSRWIGSPVYRKRMLQSHSQTMALSDEVAYLVDFVWREAMGTLSAILRVPVRSIQLEKVEKAEAVLLEIRRAIESDEEEDTIRSISDRFFALIPHRPGHTDAILTKRAIARKQDICQLIKDIVNANESTGWSQLSDAASKYRALNCVIDWLKPGHTERERVEDLVISTQEEKSPVTIRNVFAVSRSVEEARYNHTVGNNQLLLHCSRPANFLGILSRGLLLPKIVVSELGVGRRDAGMLGSGLYFGDKSSTASQYSSPSELTGTRLMVVARVALGKIKQIFKHDLTIEAPPEGFNSTHGVSREKHIQSDFTEGDEFVVYAADQQCIQYVVEFTEPGDSMETFARTISVDDVDYHPHPAIEKLITKIDVADVQCAPNPVAKVQPGLVAKGENQPMVELQAVHVRARIQDLAAQVIVLQSYKNHSDTTIEAKYVFPLDDEAAVCGFEAFINNKHVVGVVKEKEEAKQEYQRAVAAGHGAYLMDEEAPNVFSVSVGNLPPKANVLIKIIYVTELAVEGSRLAFNLLGSVAPWKRKEIQAKDAAEDSEACHVDASAQNREESLQLSLQMASDIRSIESPTHLIKVKSASSQGSVELSEGAGLGDSFQLFIGLAEIHSPRLWVETLPDDSSQAAMLVFYPDFVTNVINDPEIIVMLDLSNSMQGNSLEEARALTQLILKQLPAACTFNVVIFGTEYEELFPSSQTKVKSSLNKALDFIQTSKANRGSTEAWNPLHAYFILKHSNRKPCNIFLVTDGHVTNEETTLAAVNQNRETSRIFTFGISSTANHHTLRSMSRLGGGAFEYFDAKAKSTWEKKVRQQVTRSCQPAVSNIRVEWETNDSAIIQAPAQITTVFSGSRLVIYAINATCSQVVLKADVPVSPYGSKEVTTKFTAEDLKKSQGKVLHQLAARSIVRDWEEGALHANRLHHEARKSELQSEIVSLSKEFSIITPFTSFIAVEEREKGEDLSQETGPSIEELVARENVDIIPSMDWQEINPPTEVSPEKQVKSLLHTANTATETFSFDAAEKYYEDAYKVAEEKLTPGSSLTLEIADTLSKFYFRVRRRAKKAFSVIDKARKKQQEIVKPVLPEEVTEPQDIEQLDQLEKAAEWAQLCQSLEESFEPVDIGPADVLTEYEKTAESWGSIEELYEEGGDHFEPVEEEEEEEEIIVQPDTPVECADEESPSDLLELREHIVQPARMAARAPSPELQVLKREYYIEPIEERLQEPAPRMFARAASPELIKEYDSYLEPMEKKEFIIEPVPRKTARAHAPELITERSYQIEPLEEKEELIVTPQKMAASEPLTPDAKAEVPSLPPGPTPTSSAPSSRRARALAPSWSTPKFLQKAKPKKKERSEEKKAATKPRSRGPPPSRAAPPPLPVSARSAPPPPPPPAGAAPALGAPPPPPGAPPPPQPPQPLSVTPPSKQTLLDQINKGVKQQRAPEADFEPILARREISVDGSLSDSDDEVVADDDDDWEIDIDRTRSIKDLDYDAIPEEPSDEKTEQQELDELLGEAEELADHEKVEQQKLDELSDKAEALASQAGTFSDKTKKKKKFAFGIRMPKREEKEPKKVSKPPKMKEDATPIAKIPIARKHKPKLDTAGIEKLLSLRRPGFDWQFSSPFDKVLGIESKICIDVIKHSQMAPGASGDRLANLETLLATILAVSHLKMFLDSLPSKRSPKVLALCDRVQEAIDTAEKMIGVSLRQDDELEDMPNKAGLGTDWWDIGSKFLGNVK